MLQNNRPEHGPFIWSYWMKKIFYRAIDFSKVDTLVYHMPNGPPLSVEIGDICDTSEIDGVVHFFPKGNA